MVVGLEVVYKDVCYLFSVRGTILHRQGTNSSLRLFWLVAFHFVADGHSRLTIGKLT